MGGLKYFTSILIKVLWKNGGDWRQVKKVLVQSECRIVPVNDTIFYRQLEKVLVKSGLRIVSVNGIIF